MSEQSLADYETVLRHIPGGNTFQAPGPRITSKNFTLRSHIQERGFSVSRTRLTTPADLIARLGNPARGSKVASATVGDLRALGYDVIADPLSDDAGHALIVSGTESIEDRTACRKLANLFQFIDAHP